VLIGPRGRLCRGKSAPCCCGSRTILRLALGPRILRADTAAVAALALVQAVLGDWGTSDGRAAEGFPPPLRGRVREKGAACSAA
jgi:16S rRNA (uracil1498-N3)-methyltransferase